MSDLTRTTAGARGGAPFLDGRYVMETGLPKRFQYSTAISLLSGATGH